MSMGKQYEMVAKWTFLTNHAHVLLCLSKYPDMRMRDLALEVGITERAVQRIISDLADEEYITIVRNGRCNRYLLNEEMPLKHPLEARSRIGDFLQMVDAGINRPDDEDDYDD